VIIKAPTTPQTLSYTTLRYTKSAHQY